MFSSLSYISARKTEELYTRSGIVTQIVSNSKLMADKFPYTQ